jgi:hypothetical protein
MKSCSVVRRWFPLVAQLELRLAKARGQVDKLTPSLLAFSSQRELSRGNRVAGFLRIE